MREILIFQCLASCYRPFRKVLGSQTYRKSSNRVAPGHDIISWWDHHREDGTVVLLRCSSGTESYDGNFFQIPMTADHCSNCERCRMIMQNVAF